MSMRAYISLIFVIVIGLFLPIEAAIAAHVEPLKTPLPAVPANNPILILDTPSGKKKLSLIDLERLPMKQSTLRTNFGMAGTFQGVMLSDLLAAYGLAGADKITLVASDDYAATVRKSDLQTSPALLATRFNGKPIDDPTKGPLILLWPEEEQAALTGEKDDAGWVWSIIKIHTTP